MGSRADTDPVEVVVPRALRFGPVTGAFLARVDLAWPEHRVAVEYDGVWHAAEEHLHRDRRRLNRLLGADWIVLHVTAKRLRDDFDGFVAELRTALRSRPAHHAG